MFESVRQRRTNNTLLFRGRYRHNLAYLRFRNLLHSRLKVCDLKTSRERNRNKKGSQHKQSVMIRKLRTLVRPRDHGLLLMEIANVHPVIKPFQSLTHNLIDFCFSFFLWRHGRIHPKMTFMTRLNCRMVNRFQQSIANGHKMLSLPFW